MQLNPVASTVLVIFYVVTSVSLVAVFGFLLHALNKLNAKLESLEAKVDPLLVKAEEILTLANAKIVTLGERTEGILTHGEALAEEVHEKIDRTASGVQRTVNAPIIGLNSVAAGLMQGLQTFRLLQRRQATSKTPHLSHSRSSDSSEQIAPAAAETAVTLNGGPVALRAGREH